MASKKGRKRAPVRQKPLRKLPMDPKEVMKGLSPKDRMSMMHEEMQKMMASCFATMSDQERASTLSMCRNMLDDLEK